MPVVGLVGCGNMGSSIVKRLIDDGVQPNLIKVVDNHPEKVQDLGIEPSTYEDLKGVEALILTVKPWNIKDTIKQIPLSSNTLLISMAAGVDLDTLSKWAPKKQPICRVMPNIGVRVGSGIAATAFNEYVNSSHKENIRDVLAPLGKTLFFKEKDFDTVTALVGGGPAFASLLLEGCVLGGIAGGLSKPVAKELLLETFKSTIQLLEGGMSFEDLRYMVSSPAGSTIEGLEILESHGVRGSIIEAIKASSNRAEEIGKQYKDN